MSDARLRRDVEAAIRWSDSMSVEFDYCTNYERSCREISSEISVPLPAHVPEAWVDLTVKTRYELKPAAVSFQNKGEFINWYKRSLVDENGYLERDSDTVIQRLSEKGFVVSGNSRSITSASGKYRHRRPADRAEEWLD